MVRIVDAKPETEVEYEANDALESEKEEMLGGSDSGWFCCRYNSKCVQAKSKPNAENAYKTLFPNDDFTDVYCESQACSASISKDNTTCIVTSPQDPNKAMYRTFYYDEGYGS